MRENIQTFDFFRVIGSLLIFLCHIPFFNTYIGGGIGVEMFFVLSGFVMTLGHGGNEKFLIFLTKRLNRLYPLYFITLILGLLYMTLVLDYDWIRSVAKLPIYLLCAQTLTPIFSATGFNSPSWYVATLIWIYVFFHFLKRLKNVNLGGVMFMYVTILISIQPIINEYDLGTWLYYFSPYTRVLDFMLGVMTARIYICHPLNISSKWTMTYLEAIALIAFVFCVIFEDKFHFILEAGVLLSIVFYIFSIQRGYISAFLRIPVFRYLSKFTYSFYLVHYLVIMTMTKLLNPTPGFSLHNFGIIISMLSISIILSFSLTRLTNNIKLAVVPSNVNIWRQTLNKYLI